MDDTQFTVSVNNTDYTIKVYSTVPKLYEVTCGVAYHQIGKTDAGMWVYVESPTSSQHMPLQEIGRAIDEYLGEEVE